MAHRGRDTLRFGPMKPVGLVDPRTGRLPYAVVQLRQDNLAGDHFSLVGFQTQLKWGEQARVLRLIPGLEQAEFVRFGMVHRNTYINGPTVLRADVADAGAARPVLRRPDVGRRGLRRVGGVGAARRASTRRALALGRAAVVRRRGRRRSARSRYYVSHADPAHYQPTNITFGIMPPLDRPPRGKADRKQALSARALDDLDGCLREVGAEREPDGARLVGGARLDAAHGRSPSRQRPRPAGQPRRRRDRGVAEGAARGFLDFLALNRTVSPHTVRAYDSDLSQFLAHVAAGSGRRRADLGPRT